MAKRIVIAIMLVSLFGLSACNKPDPGEAARNNFLPPQGFQGDAAKGENLYVQACSSCHGPGAHGSDNGPPLVHKIYESSHHSDISFFHAAKNGVAAHHWQFGNMPPVPGVTPKDVAHIVAYVRREQRAVGIR